MKRQYTLQDFELVVDTLSAQVPNVTIATDIICGFPTETEQDFEKTLELVEKYKFPVLHISQFYPRKGTPAARMPLLPSLTVKNRSRKLTRLFESYSRDESIVGSEFQVLVTERSADGIHLVAHDKSFTQILIPIPDNAADEWIGQVMGRKVLVKATKCGKWYVMAELKSELDGIQNKNMPKYVRIQKELVRIDGKSDFEPVEKKPKFMVFVLIASVLIAILNQELLMQSWDSLSISYKISFFLGALVLMTELYNKF